MYEELVEALRLCVRYGKAADVLANALKAADAIEGLERQVFDMSSLIGDYSEKTRWIPVTEEPPKAYEDVLLLFTHNQAAGFCDRDGCWSVYSGDGFYTEVADNEPKPTHWARKLPEPQKEKEK